MTFFKKLVKNTGHLMSGTLNSTSKTNKDDEVGVAGVSNKDNDSDRQAIYAQWFFSAKLGQPRNVDTAKIRTLSKSAWVQMVLSTFKKQIMSMEWDIVPANKDDETDYSKKIKEAKQFFNKINKNKQGVKNINSELITDLGEIDAGVLNYVYTMNSYNIGEVPIYNSFGEIIGTERGLVLKPLGQRELTQVKTVDGSTILKQVDIHKNLQRFYQYSFKHPRLNPTPFELEEIEYILMNEKSYSVYGFSPVQCIQQVIELLIQGTRYNKDIFTNNAIPDMVATLPKLPFKELQKLKRIWNNEFKGKPHQVGFINWPIENLHKLAESNRDLEWLDGQKWYFKLVFAVFGVSPTEAGFFENSNKSNDEGQERVTVRNALKPYTKVFEDIHTNKTLTELFQDEKHGLKFVYISRNHVQEKIEFEQKITELNVGALTINEYRQMQGKKPVAWGDEPMNRIISNLNTEDSNENKNDKNKQKYKKSFEEFINGK